MIALLLAATVINPDGAWCWFQDERAVFADSKLVAGSVSRAGDVQVTVWDPKTGRADIQTLHAGFERDDHDTPGLVLLQDGRLAAFYARHGGPKGANRMFSRVTVRPHDASEWGPERSFDAGVSDGFSYANPFLLTAERNRLYLFWRAKDYNPTWSASDDSGVTWSAGANHIYSRKGERPYVKYASNGRDTIHFAFTDGHPNRPYRNNLYHVYYRAGGLHRSDGTFVRKLADGPITTAEATRIYDGENSPTGEAWVWDLHLDRQGNPVVVYSTHPDPMDHRYRYARWNGKGWEDRQIAYAGKRLYEREQQYSGGICLDPDNINTIYLSSDVRLEDGKPNSSGHWELYQGVTRDGGKTWRFEALTRDSKVGNLRPIVPAGHPAGRFVLWYRGVYRAYTDYETEIVLLR